MGDHYLARGYLSGFADPRYLNSVWVHSRHGTPPYRANVTKVAQENQLYSPEVEFALQQKIEDPFYAALEVVRAFTPLSNTERVAITDFIISTMRRTPVQRDALSKQIADEGDEYLEDFKRRINLAADQDPGLRPKVELLNKQLQDRSAKSILHPHQIWQKLIPPSNYPLMRGAILEMNWCFVVSSDRSFLTADSPFFFFREAGLGHPQVEISMPLTSRIAILARRGGFYSEGYYRAPESVIKHINRRTVVRSSKYVFAHSNAKWITKLATNRTFQLPLILDKTGVLTRL